MKKNILIVSTLILVLFFGCNLDTPVDGGTDLWSDSPTVSSNLDLSNVAPPASSSILSKNIARTVLDTNKIYFRSSDIEFWAIASESDLNSIFSSKYKGWGEVDNSLGYADGESLEYLMGDNIESIVFYPYTDYAANVGNDLNPDWDTHTSEFIAAGKTLINLARLDIGGGSISFVIDGEERNICHADGNNANGINANSIFFIDQKFLSKSVLITRDIESQLQNDTITASDLSLSDTEFSFIKTLFLNNNYVDNETMIDVDGALCIPLDPVDISSYNPATNHLQIEVSWNIANAIHIRNGEYFMDNRVGNTAFNFNVALTIQ